ncbi:4096_t:CDS:2 [Cetraspora pellucida]|uniref:4096_t:CDS:1 n=1 Tax=Cetraspora pellucida TaxID=1433469 RepID=A0A9N9C740_9GLOM|nr:4096_t:CDS:2 [Cetraspora pellucida]
MPCTPATARSSKEISQQMEDVVSLLENIHASLTFHLVERSMIALTPRNAVKNSEKSSEALSRSRTPTIVVNNFTQIVTN